LGLFDKYDQVIRIVCEYFHVKFDANFTQTVRKSQKIACGAQQLNRKLTILLKMSRKIRAEGAENFGRKIHVF
jgi:hypothetical protein